MAEAPAADSEEPAADSEESSADAEAPAAEAPVWKANMRVRRHSLVNVLVSCLVMTSFSLLLPIQQLPIQTRFDTTSFVHIAAMLAGSIDIELAGE